MKCIVILATFAVCLANHLKFPDYFRFGVASSAYQIEGGGKETGRGQNIWDKFIRDFPAKIKDRSHADIACNSYHKIKEDVELLKHLGVDFYRFSLSWSRILPTGFTDKINPTGVRYYNELINELIRHKIEPVVTLYQLDLPQKLQDLGGWPNPFLVNYFADYARVAFQKFGDRVKKWITLSTPHRVCQVGYTDGREAPGYNSSGFANYMCSYTVLLAHAKVYHIYYKEFREKQKGQIGITADTNWFEPKSSEHAFATEMALQATFGWFMNPIYSKEGDFPPLMKEKIANKSFAQSLQRSRLPRFTAQEIEYIRGTADFLGLNHYSTSLVRLQRYRQDGNVYTNSDFDYTVEYHTDWKETPTAWIKIVPWGLRKLLKWIKLEYNNPTIYIFENGVADTKEILNDHHRIRYMRSYLNAILESIYKDGVDVRGYTAWSLMDSFEWSHGYTLKFGLHHVDFNDPHRKRTAKASALYYSKITRTRHTSHDIELVSEFKHTSGTHLFHANRVFYTIIFIIYYIKYYLY